MIDFEIIDSLDNQSVKTIEQIAFIESPVNGDFFQILFDKEYNEFIVHKNDFFYRILKRKISILDTILFFLSVNSKQVLLTSFQCENKKSIRIKLQDILNYNWKSIYADFRCVKMQVVLI